jgi:hypothetical protein
MDYHWEKYQEEFPELEMSLIYRKKQLKFSKKKGNIPKESELRRRQYWLEVAAEGKKGEKIKHEQT